MKTAKSTKQPQEMLPEYGFDYSKAKPNRFAAKQTEAQQVTVTLDPDVAKIFTTSEAVNKALRAILSAVPSSQFKSG